MPGSRSRERVETPPQPHDLPSFLPYACAQLQAPFVLRVRVREPDEYDGKADKWKKSKSRASMPRMSTSMRSSRAIAVADSVPKFSESSTSSELPLTVLRSGAGPGQYAELRLERQPRVPPLLLRLLALCLPHQPALERLTVRRVGLDAAALADMARLLPLSHLTDVCLDDSPAEHACYDELLGARGQLRRLSLARVQLGDAGCGTLAGRLSPPWPASRTLRMLTLSSNGITDAGAAVLADALRTNRTLQYLSLAGNAVSDDGAVAILDVLMEFRLTREEVVAERRRRMNYLREYDAVYKRCYDEAAAAQVRRGSEEGRRGQRGGGGSRGGSPGAAAEGPAGQARAAATEVMGGPFRDPFAEVEVRGADVYSKGNLVLSALNLAYNRVGYRGLLRLQDVLEHQGRQVSSGPGAGGGGGGGGRGLVRVVLQGNPLPPSDAAFERVQRLLEHKALAGSGGKLSRRKSMKSTTIVHS